ncbi:MAG TPA: branched-chain amino acid ABC transporter permease [Azospirillum sp.]|nr:branched-chain amino acid ABC transporter permease [Azospirillum sp.]
MPLRDITTPAFFLGAAAALLVSVTLASPQVNDWVFRCCTLIMLATSWNLMANAGLISLGHSAFWGVGSYAAVLTANGLGLSLWLALLPAFAVGVLLGAFLAFATGRLRGIFFAISTLALSEGLRITAFMLPEVTSGAVGVFLKQELRPSQQVLYSLGVLGAIGSVALAWWLSRTRFHYACRAMRNNEAAAQMLGINPMRYRLGVLMVSGGMASLAGGINAWYGGYLDPGMAFTLHFTILSQIAPILGGIHTLVGPVIGSIGIIFLSEGTRIAFGANEGYSQLIFGVVLVIGILFMPHGIYGVYRRLRQRAARPRNHAPTHIHQAAEGTPKEMRS